MGAYDIFQKRFDSSVWSAELLQETVKSNLKQLLFLSSTDSSDLACYCSLSCMLVIAPSWPCRSKEGLQSAAITSRIIVLLSYEANFFLALCMMSFCVSSFIWLLRSPVIISLSLVLVTPSEQPGKPSLSCLWHGLTHVRSGHHDGLCGCQWKPWWTVSGLERGGPRDLHDCVQEPLGSGKTPVPS